MFCFVCFFCCCFIINVFFYRETIQRVNVKFNDDGTINYQEHRDYKFLPELSKGRQSDRLNVPNLPLLGAAAMSKYSYLLTRFSMSTLFTTLNAQPFINLPAHRFMWGYDDNLYELAKGVLALRNESPLDKFGIMANVSCFFTFFFTLQFIFNLFHSK